jgi:hypothetical protein
MYSPSETMSNERRKGHLILSSPPVKLQAMSFIIPCDSAHSSDSPEFSTLQNTNFRAYLTTDVIVCADFPELAYTQQPGLFERLEAEGFRPSYVSESKARATLLRLRRMGLDGPFTLLTECHSGTIDTRLEKRLAAEAKAQLAEQAAQLAADQIKESEDTELNAVRSIGHDLCGRTQTSVYSLVALVRLNERRRVLAEIEAEKTTS